MAAYFVVHVTGITDADKLAEYRDAAGPVTAAHGGKIIAANAPGVLEGESSTERVIIVEFPDMAALQAWYASEDYKPLAQLRMGATDGFAFAVDGA